MLRHLLIALTAAAVVGTSIIPDDALAARRGAAAARGPRGGGVAVGPRGGAVAVGPRGNVAASRGYGYRGHPVARGAAWGAAGAAAVGAGYYYGNDNGYNNNSNCYRDSYGQVVCPNQYPYQSGY
jgi:hypothetical protein